MKLKCLLSANLLLRVVELFCGEIHIMSDIVHDNLSVV